MIENKIFALSSAYDIKSFVVNISEYLRTSRINDQSRIYLHVLAI
jgi:hypothetical protein